MDNLSDSMDSCGNRNLNVHHWHEETAEMNRQLLEMQPMVGGLLNKMMSFSNDVTENYILRFAKMQIELFNLIADNYEYHKQALENSSDQDYANAVSNYMEFLDMIADNLSLFGIEEIKSDCGTGFDGSIHEVVGNMDFSPRSSMVAKSVRMGFRYKDVVIQKEKIIV